MDGLAALGEVFRSRREELGLSLHEVSRRAGRLGVGLSVSQLRRIEAGAVPRGDHLVALCRVYGMAPGFVHDLLLVSGERAVRVATLADLDAGELLRQGDELAQQGRLARARPRFLVARAKARKAGDAETAWGAVARLGWVDMVEGHENAALFGFASVLEAEDALPEDREIARLHLLRLHVRMGWREHARALAGIVREIARDRSRKASIRGVAWAALALYEGKFGNADEARAYWRTAMRALRRAGQETERIRAGIGYVDLLLEQGRPRDALRAARDLERETRRSELRGLRRPAVERLGRALLAAGRPGDAIPWLAEARELAADAGEDIPAARALLLECLARARAGETDAARELLRMAVADSGSWPGEDEEVARLFEEAREALRPAAGRGPGRPVPGPAPSRRPRAEARPGGEA